MRPERTVILNEVKDLLLDGVSKAKIDGGKAKLLEAPKVPII
jgi:hypothetical protein